MKTYRRFIRTALGEIKASPQFRRKVDADLWYEAMLKQKASQKDNINILQDGSVTFMEWARTWMTRRLKTHPMATTNSDHQRLTDYILPFLAETPIVQIKSPHIRNLLVKICEPGFQIPGESISISTRTRVQALLSVIFSDALNEDPPLVEFNPVLGIKFKDKRVGKHRPRTLANKESCLKFLKAAQKTGWNEYLACSIFLMTGMRKQELIALRWSCVDWTKRLIHVREKYEQASNSIISGTKAGEKEVRAIPVPAVLIGILKDHKKRSKPKSDDAFVISRPSDGRHVDARTVSVWMEEVRKRAQVDISAHGLRHTFGREFALNTGNMKALQAILGHSSSAVTDIYSELAGERIKGFGESVVFDVKE